VGHGKEGLRAIAKRPSKSGGASEPIQLRAQVLRELPSPVRAAPGFFLPDGEPAAAGDGAVGNATWRPSAVEYAVAALEAAGVRDYRIEIAPDGTIAVVVGKPRSASPCET
jgi:hypothetical protein